MKIKAGQEDAYAKYVAKNDDPYSKGIVEFTERWADLMEQALVAGQTIEACMKQTSHDADTEGITGFMYGCAVRALSHFWEHGETLRVAHNLQTQIGTEGEKANKEGGVLNPALLSIDL